MSAGSRWAFLANAVIAFKGEDEYFRKKASVTVIQALCNKVRAPSSSGGEFPICSGSENSSY
ncbi:hypothetical protein F5877DRAFT_86832 [Lentinula edodes]|nr:hypothetical protein F5877DRAFT_86832 [Lentinula edodes]